MSVLERVREREEAELGSSASAPSPVWGTEIMTVIPARSCSSAVMEAYAL